MFVSKARYKELEAKLTKLSNENLELKAHNLTLADWQYRHYSVREELSELRGEHNRLVERWNRLAEEVNSKGGRDFMDNAIIFPRDEIKSLLSLVHPDKHNGKESAVRWTQKLLELRGRG